MTTTEQINNNKANDIVINALKSHGVPVEDLDLKFTGAGIVTCDDRAFCKYFFCEPDVVAIQFSTDHKHYQSGWECQPSIEKLHDNPELKIYPTIDLFGNITYTFKENDGYARIDEYLKSTGLRCSYTFGYNRETGNYIQVVCSKAFRYDPIFQSDEFRAYVNERCARLRYDEEKDTRIYLKGIFSGIAVSCYATSSQVILDAITFDQEIDLNDLIAQGRIKYIVAKTLMTVVDTAMCELKIDGDLWKRLLKIKFIEEK